MDLPTIICIKHNGDDKPEDRLIVKHVGGSGRDLLQRFIC
jgi:hypothetical protein